MMSVVFQASDLSSSSAACKSLLRTYKRIAEKAQAETPHTLVRACKYVTRPGSQTGPGTLYLQCCDS